ncbi:MAG: UDP-N-acetylmuramate dehydrogenase [Deltaproteobacteria bacterium]|nr:UDP-N-acetylmuramate dehydrogenase [Deltaproteobacteria bacterium]
MSGWREAAALAESSPLAWPGVRGPVFADYPLAPLTTWKVGGPARYLAVPSDLEDVFQLFRRAGVEGWPLFFLGRGSNVLIADAGLPGLTLHLARAFQGWERREDRWRVGAGVSLPRLARQAAAWGVSGFEFLAGIPGTVGGAVRLNAGAHGRSLAGLLTRVWVATPGLHLLELPAGELELGYRSSRLLSLPHWLVVEAEFRLPAEASPAAVRQRMRELLTARRARQPSHPRTCGSVFKNPPAAAAAGYLIEAAGLKGRRRGDAQVSRRHANFIINRGQAQAGEIQALIREVEEEVRRRHGVRLEREVVFLPGDYAGK